MDISLDKAFNLKKKKNLSVSSLPGDVEGNNLSDANSGEGVGIGQGGSPGGDTGNGLGAGKGGFLWRGSGEGTGLGQGGSSGGRPGYGLGSGNRFRAGRSPSEEGLERDRNFGQTFFPLGGAAGAHDEIRPNPKPPYPEEAREKDIRGSYAEGGSTHQRPGGTGRNEKSWP